MNKIKYYSFFAFITVISLNSNLILCVGNIENDDFILYLEKNDTLIYEYNIVNISLLNEIEEENESYKNMSLSNIEDHSKIKYKVYDIYEDYAYWVIRFSVYIYNSHLDELIGYMDRYCVKFSDEFFNEMYSMDIFEILPTNVNSFLLELRELLDDYNITSIHINDRSIVFNYVELGYNQSSVFSYNQHGILSRYSLLHKGHIAFEKILISFTRKNNKLPFLTITVIIGICLIFGVYVFVYIKRKKRKTMKRRRQNKILRHIR